MNIKEFIDNFKCLSCLQQPVVHRRSSAAVCSCQRTSTVIYESTEINQSRALLFNVSLNYVWFIFYCESPEQIEFSLFQNKSNYAISGAEGMLTALLPISMQQNVIFIFESNEIPNFVL